MIPPFHAVLFDCDGVLADSEGVVNEVVAAELTALGWPLDGEAARRAFLGLALPDMRAMIEARVGPLPAGWGERLSERIAARLAAGLRAMPGAPEAAARLARRGVPLAVCSNSARGELAAKLGALGLAPLFGGRVFSFEDVARPKPAPDLYLAAAAAVGVSPAECLVVEDSAPGVASGLAAGCRVVSLVPGLGVPVIALEALA